MDIYCQLAMLEDKSLIKLLSDQDRIVADTAYVILMTRGYQDHTL